ncbi:DinB family protein [Paenibacillus sp. Marseille-Q4541]|uniref:DinB family protein n=1 Tax=Paenibacillus sp. Marseille-Q4541 TaxID=2831522 RepID=UPI001BA61EF3|nr:DinB family protein [Paenibacillus sp. Marseille-Q4541]
MKMLFEYNWQVREDWFNWCEQVDEEELTTIREGGLGSILRTLFHIVDIEQAWMRGLQGVPEFHYSYDDYPSLAAIKALSDQCRPDVQRMVQHWSHDTDQKMFFNFTYAEVVRHVIAHEIHHIGQLSVWSREIGRKPVNANLILRGLTLSL